MSEAILFYLLLAIPLIAMGMYAWFYADKQKGSFIKQRGNLKTPFSWGDFLTGILFFGLAVFTLVTASRHHGTQVTGFIFLAVGGYWIGLSAPRVITPQSGKSKK